MQKFWSPLDRVHNWTSGKSARVARPDSRLGAGSCFTPGTPVEDGIVDFGKALDKQPDDHLIFGESRGGDDIAAYFPAGGTSGVPKLVAHTQRSQLGSAFGGAAMCGYTSNDILTATMPLFHVAGTIIAGLSAFMAGVELVVISPGGLRNPEIVKGFWRLVAQHKVTVIGGVLTAIGVVLQEPVGDKDISALRTGCYLHEILEMTELSGLVSIDPLSGPVSVGSVGCALP